MKLFIGIYQNKSQIDNYLNSLGIKHRHLVEVGPFTSKIQAMEWMEYVGEKLKPYAAERYSLGCLYPNTWYGATFESIESEYEN